MVLLFYDIMKIDFIPFQIGEEYENWEFELNYEEELKYFDKYQYIGKDFLELLNQNVENTYLYFNTDILVRIDIKLGIKCSEKFHSISTLLKEKIKKEGELKYLEKEILQKEWKDISLILLLRHNLIENTLYVICMQKEYFNI